MTTKFFRVLAFKVVVLNRGQLCLCPLVTLVWKQLLLASRGQGRGQGYC